MHTRQLRTFVAAASTLNFTRAADAVNLAPSSVSEQIQALENELGTALFDRSRRGFQLTPAGERFHDYARELLELTDEARACVAAAGGKDRGTIEVGALESLAALWLPPLLSRFLRYQPDISVNVRIANSKTLRSSVRSGDLDVCIALGAASADDDLLHRSADHSPIVVALSSDHRLSDLASLTLQDLFDEAFIVTGTGCVYRQMFDRAFSVYRNRQPAIASEVGSIAATMAMVAAGLGCAIVPRIAVTQQAGIALLPLVDIAVLPITVSWRRRRVQRPALRRFLAEALPGCTSDEAVPAIDMQHRPRGEAVA